MSDKHTAGKRRLRVEKDEDASNSEVWYVDLIEGDPGCDSPIATVEVISGGDLDDAHRLAACWNALEGIANPAAVREVIEAARAVADEYMNGDGESLRASARGLHRQIAKLDEANTTQQDGESQ